MENNLDQILEKVSDLYWKYGIRSVTMDDVAQEMGVSKKTLYLHFRNKEELVEKTLKWRMEHPHFSFNVKADGEDNAIDRYQKFNEFLVDHLRNVNTSLEFDLCKYYPELFKELHHLRMERFRKGIQENLEQGVKEKLFRPDLNVEFISKMLVNFYFNFWKEEYYNFTKEEMRSLELHQELTTYHLHGICSEEGIKYLKRKSQQ